MPQSLSITLLGTGSSGGVPRVGGDWGACDPDEPRNRRLRCSALIRKSDTNTPDQTTQLLIDTSPDMREQLLAAGIRHLDGIVYSHDHADQTHGIDDVRALVLRHRKQIPVWMDAPTARTLVPKFQYCFEGSGGYPAILNLNPFIVPGVAFRVTGAGGGIDLLPLHQKHGRIVSLGFRIGPIAYCNDVSALPDETLAQLAGLDVLVLDALRYTPHPTHAHVDLALSWIAHLKPKRAILTNLHVDLDYRTLCETLPPGVEPAYDGLCLDVTLND